MLLGVVWTKVQAIVGDSQCAPDGAGPRGGEGTNERDVLVV